MQIHTPLLLLLPGDGIGPEILAQCRRMLDWLRDRRHFNHHAETGLVGGAALDVDGVPITESTMALAHRADCVLLACVGGPEWDDVVFHKRPEQGLLRLRKELQLFANLRPAKVYPALVDASTLKPEIVRGLDILIVRELTGGVYFGEPKGIEDLPNGEQRGIDTQVYTTGEIQRIARVAFELAARRRNHVCSSEKSNVMQSGRLWKSVVSRLHTAEYPDVRLTHMLADALAMQLVRNPGQFDVIVTDNLFGDMLSDEAAMLTGSLGMLPSASLGAPDPVTHRRRALYEPVHGSAPDIAGQNVANPLAMILSLCMALRFSFHRDGDADLIERAIEDVLAAGIRTADIATDGATIVGTAQMGDAVLAALERLAPQFPHHGPHHGHGPGGQ